MMILVNEMHKKKVHPLLRVFLEARRHWIWYILFFCLSIGGALAQTTTLRLYGQLVDLGISGQTTAMLSTAPYILILLLLYLCSVILQNIVNANGTERIFIELRMRAYTSLLNAEASVLDSQFRSGDTVTRLNNDMYQFSESIAGRFTWFLSVIIMALVALVNCLLLSWQLSLVYIVLLPLSIWVTRKISAPIEAQQKERSASVGKAMGVAVDMLHGLMITKSYNLADIMVSRFSAHADAAVASAVEAEKVSVKLYATRYIFGLIPPLSIIALGFFLVANNIATAGVVVAFIAISIHIRTALGLLDYMASAIRMAAAQATRVYEIIDLPPETEGSEFSRSETEPIVEMDHLQFFYEGQKELFKALTFNVKHGEKVGLVGPSGCGKSSIIRLICRLNIHQGGIFRIFGHAAMLWSPDALRKGISIVTQDPSLFEGTIYENVRYGRLEASCNEVMQAIDNAYLSDFIASLPNGVETQIGESGTRLSGGQKQRIAIARAMLKDAPLVLLDEATSALDAESEIEVQKALDRLLNGRAAIIVAHRLSTLSNVDRILFIENGVVVEQGTREDLMRRRGRFFEMAALQTEAGDMHE